MSFVFKLFLLLLVCHIVCYLCSLFMVVVDSMGLSWQAFVDFPLEILPFAISKMHKKYETKFAIDKFTIEMVRNLACLISWNRFKKYWLWFKIDVKLQLMMCTICAEHKEFFLSNLNQTRTLELALKDLKARQVRNSNSQEVMKMSFAKMLCHN